MSLHGQSIGSWAFAVCLPLLTPGVVCNLTNIKDSKSVHCIEHNSTLSAMQRLPSIKVSDHLCSTIWRKPHRLLHWLSCCSPMVTIDSLADVPTSAYWERLMKVDLHVMCITSLTNQQVTRLGTAAA